jgi:2,5-dihydroxypyridine 5,6-dioxygenase
VTDLTAADLTDLFRRELQLCAVKPGESLVVLAEPSSRPEYVAAAFGAAKSLGAHVIQATVPGGSPVPLPSVRTGSGAGLLSVDANPLAQQLMFEADIVVDLTNEGFIHTTLLKQILQHGTRVIFVADAPEVLARNIGQPEDKLRAKEAVELLRGGRELVVTSAAGTDLVASLENGHPGYQCGFADDPGRWDHWPSLMVVSWPLTSRGTIVLAPGDVLLPFKTYVQEPVTLSITDGRIADIKGGADARLLEMFLEDADDEEAYYLSHMGWGLMKTADWFSLSMYDKESNMGMDARAMAGNFLFSTGPHPFMGRDTYNHLDIPLRGCTIRVDDKVVVEEGRLLG